MAKRRGGGASPQSLQRLIDALERALAGAQAAAPGGGLKGAQNVVNIQERLARANEKMARFQEQEERPALRRRLTEVGMRALHGDFAGALGSAVAGGVGAAVAGSIAKTLGHMAATASPSSASTLSSSIDLLTIKLGGPLVRAMDAASSAAQNAAALWDKLPDKVKSNMEKGVTAITTGPLAFGTAFVKARYEGKSMVEAYKEGVAAMMGKDIKRDLDLPVHSQMFETGVDFADALEQAGLDASANEARMAALQAQLALLQEGNKLLTSINAGVASLIKNVPAFGP